MKLEEFKNKYPEFNYNYYINFNYDLLKVKNILEHFDTIGKDEVRIISFESFKKYNPEFNYYYFLKKYEHFIKSYLLNNVNQLNICLTYCFFRKLWKDAFFGLINLNKYKEFITFYTNYYTNLFNYKYYFNKYPDLNENGLNNKSKLLNHWLKNGIKEGRIGSIKYIRTKIDYEYYLKKNPDLRENGIKNNNQVLKHYINNGVKENREINYYEKIKYLNIEFYKLYYEDLQEIKDDLSIIEHYIYIGISEGRLINIDDFINHTGFDWDFYVNYYKDINTIDNKIEAIYHYIKCGKKDGREFNYNKIIKKYNFDYNFYIKYYDDLNNNENESIKHFLIKGLDEGRYPNSSKIIFNFDINFYKNYYKDIQNLSNKDIIDHYIYKGSKEGRMKNNNINYLKTNEKKIIIIYSYYERKNEQKNQTNLSFFIKYGLDKSKWKNMDITTLIIINGKQCELLIPKREDIIILKRDYNGERDIGTYRIGIEYLENKYNKNLYEKFNYLFIINAGVFGPIYEYENLDKHWLDPFFKKIDKEKSVICSPLINFLKHSDPGGPGPRCQTYCSLIKINKIIYDLLLNTKISNLSENTDNKNSELIYDYIIKSHKEHNNTILIGEYGLSRILLNHGFNISCLIYDNLNYFDTNIYNYYSHRIDRNDDYKEEYFYKTVFIKNNWFISENKKDSYPVLYQKTINYNNKKLKFSKIYENFKIEYDYESLNLPNNINLADHHISILRDEKNNILYNCNCKKKSDITDCIWCCNKFKLVSQTKKETYNLFGYSEEVIIWPKQQKKNRSVVIYCHYDNDNIIKDYVIQGLKTLILLKYDIIFCTTCDEIKNVDLPFEINYFKNKGIGSDIYNYYEILSNKNFDNYKWILLMNDSILFPIHNLENMRKTINEIRNEQIDFWGLYESDEICIHLCSCFIEIKNYLIKDLLSFYEKKIKICNSTQDIIKEIECNQTNYLVKCNFKYKAVISYKNLEKCRSPLFNPVNINTCLNKKELFGIKWKYLGNYIEYEKINNYYLNYLMRYLKIGDKIPDIPNHFN